MNMENRLIKKWMDAGMKPSGFEFFTNRQNLIIGKMPGQDAEVEYVCPHCGFYEIKTIGMNRNTTKTGRASKRFNRPEFSCSKCGKTIEVPQLKKK